MFIMREGNCFQYADEFWKYISLIMNPYFLHLLLSVSFGWLRCHLFPHYDFIQMWAYLMLFPNVIIYTIIMVMLMIMNVTRMMMVVIVIVMEMIK